MTRALSLVPATEANAALAMINDYAAAGEALGLDRPEQGDEDEDDVADWFIPLTIGREDTVGGLQSNSFFNNDPLDSGAWRDEIGWAPIDVDLAVEIPPNDDHLGYYAFVGDFDPEAIEDAVTDEDNPWADELDQDGDLYVWGDDPADADPDRITTARPIGRGGSMAVIGDDTILWAWEPEVLEDGVAAANGDEDSLADTDALGSLAEALDDAEAVAGLFSDDVEQFEGGEGPTLEPYEAFATGVRIEDEDPQVVASLFHEDDEAAEENVEALEEVVDEGTSATSREPWTTYVTFDEADVDGPVTTAVLEPTEAASVALWYRIVFTRDTLLAT